MKILKKKEQGATKWSSLIQLARPEGAPNGFTLIEILIVLFIVAMLSTLAINGYTQYRRIALLDFSVDSFISQFYELRDNTVHGDYGGSDFERISEAIDDPEGEYDPEVGNGGEAKCYGLYFVNDGEVNSIKKLELPYSDKKEFDFATSTWFSAGCDYEGMTFGEFSDVNLDKQVLILGIYVDGIESVNFAVSFIPPNGEIEVKNVRGESVDAEEIRIEIKYGESDEGKYKRNIFIDLESGQAYVTKNENVE